MFSFAGVPVVLPKGNPLEQLWAGWRLRVVRYGSGVGVVGMSSSVTPDLLYWGWWEKMLRGVQHGVGSADKVGGAGRGAQCEVGSVGDVDAGL